MTTSIHRSAAGLIQVVAGVAHESDVCSRRSVGVNAKASFARDGGTLPRCRAMGSITPPVVIAR